jgi:anaerobic magnesium-protoporphyrin IX monomethyl ester cyclase
MKVALVNPPTLLTIRNVGTMKPSLPLGLAYVAAAARRAGHEVTVIDAIAMAPRETDRDGPIMRIGAGPEEIVAAIPRDTQVIGVGCLFSFLWPSVRRLLQAMRASFPGVPIVCGGEHFSALGERSLREAPIDAIVVGEGEETFVELLAQLEVGDRRFDRIPGLAFLHAGVPFKTPQRARTRNVDEIEPPAWDLFEPDTYNRHGFANGMRLGHSMPILATRGCPYQCTFCTSPSMWTTRWYAREPSRVVDEIQSYYERYRAVAFPFQDLTAIMKRSWVIEFCQELLRRPLRIRWQFPSGTRCEAFDDDVARLMFEAGCRYVSFAPESGSDRIRELLSKRMQRDALYAAVGAAVRAGMHVTCFFMIGSPDETPRDLADTVAMVRALARRGVGDISCHYFYPAPGTALYRELDRAGQLRHDDMELMSTLLNTDLLLDEKHNYCRNLSGRALTAWRYWIFLNFYATRLGASPRLAVEIVNNLLRGRETNKLESMALDVVMKLKLRRAARANDRTGPSAPQPQSPAP